jgi:uncharacterized membrane protein
MRRVRGRERAGRGPAAWFVALVAALAAVGCDPGTDGPALEEPAAEVPSEPESFRAPASLPGDLMLVEGLLRFQPCGQGDAQPLDDGTEGEARRIVEELGYGQDRVRAAVVMEGGRLLEVRYAAPEAAGCEDLIPDAHALAQGNEPFWSLRVEGSEAIWTTPEEMDGIRYADGSWTPHDGEGWRFQAAHHGVDGVEYVSLELVPERCVDTMSGARFPFSARAEQGGRSWQGCAREGTRAFSGP